MARETIGFVRLEWVCPNCGTKNDGSTKTCGSCGSPQPENVQFQQKANQELITDEAEIAKVKAGPDIHCGFCGARNTADAKTCVQCGADLKEGKQRQAGQVLGSFKPGAATQTPCPNCGTPNPSNALRCSACGAPMAPNAAPKAPAAAAPASKNNTLLYVIIGLVAVAVIACIIFFIVSALKTKDVVGTVEEVRWERSIEIEALKPVTKEAFEEDIPSSAEVGSCESKLHHTQDSPASGAQKVCGTPYTVDTGTGAGEVVQDCQYEVYQDYCEYTVEEWAVVDHAVSNGTDLEPYWPDFNLYSDQRQGDSSETYSVDFLADDKNYTYTTSNLSTYQQCDIGSTWTLNVNAFGNVVSIEGPQ